jgi:hypothetical protein
MGFRMSVNPIKTGLTSDDCIRIKTENHRIYDEAWQKYKNSPTPIFDYPKMESITACEEDCVRACGWDMCDDGDGDSLDGELRALCVKDLYVTDGPDEIVTGVDGLVTRDGLIGFMANHKNALAKYKKRDKKCHFDEDGDPLDDREYSEKFDSAFEWWEISEYYFLCHMEQMLKDFPDTQLFEYKAG